MLNKATKHLFVFMLILLSVFIFPKASVYAVNFAEYFPLDTSITRILVTTVGDEEDIGKTYMNRVVGTELINGTQTTKIGIFPHALIGISDTFDSFYSGTNDGTTVKAWGNQSYIFDPPISLLPGTLNDGDIIPESSINCIDRVTGETTSDCEGMSSQLIDIRDVTVSDVTYPDALIIFAIDPDYPAKVANFGSNTLGFPETYTPNSNSPLTGSLTHFEIYAKGVGLIADGDIDASTGNFGALIELQSVLSNLLEGKWGYTVLEHESNGSWGSTAGTFVFNSDGTGTDTYKSNDGGILTSKTKNFTYLTTINQDGSITLTMVYADGTDTFKIVLSDDGKMFIVDSTADPIVRGIMVAIRMDESKTCTNADFSGEYYEIAYEYDPNEATPPLSPPSYKSWSGIGDSDGSGNFCTTETVNENGTISEGTDCDDYSINQDCSISDSSGYLTGDGKLIIDSTATKSTEWGLSFAMKKGDKTYSAVDMSGIWVLTKFSDDFNGLPEYGPFFNNGLWFMTCSPDTGDPTGTISKCRMYLKNGTDQSGQKFYDLGDLTFQVSDNGSFGDSLPGGAPSNAAAIGNNGNNMVINMSFSTSENYSRLIMVGVRCSNCTSNIVGQFVPMIRFDFTSCGDNVLNLYLHNPATGEMSTVKENCNDLGVSSGNLSPYQDMMVYAENINENSAYIYKYDIATKTTTQLASLSIPSCSYNENYDVVASFTYFDKIIFSGTDDCTLKSIDTDGTNITTIALPESPYSFGMFWISPDREKIVVVESRREGPDYDTGNYARLVLMNTDGTGRTVIKDEFLGDWNQVVWKPNSSEILYYYHEFDVVGGVYQGKIPKYVLIDISDGTETDLSNSDMGKDENISLFTKWGNFLSISYQELFKGETGDLIRDVSGAPYYVPSLTEAMFGWDYNGEIYFADLDGSNFRRFVEPLKGDINSDGKVDISDVILVLRMALGLDPVHPCADINGDGEVDISDVILTLRMALGLDPLRECI